MLRFMNISLVLDCRVAKLKALPIFQHSLGSCLNLPPSAPKGVLSCPRYVFSWKCVSGTASLPRDFSILVPSVMWSPWPVRAPRREWQQPAGSNVSQKKTLGFCSFSPSHSIFNAAFILNLCWARPVIPMEMLRSWVFWFGVSFYSFQCYFSYYVPFFLYSAVLLRSLKKQQKTSQRHCKSCLKNVLRWIFQV